MRSPSALRQVIGGRGGGGKVVGGVSGPFPQEVLKIAKSSLALRIGKGKKEIAFPPSL